MGCSRSVEHDRAQVREATAKSRSSTAPVRNGTLQTDNQRRGVLRCVHCGSQSAGVAQSWVDVEDRGSWVETIDNHYKKIRSDRTSHVDESNQHPSLLTTTLYLSPSLWRKGFFSGRRACTGRADGWPRLRDSKRVPSVRCGYCHPRRGIVQARKGEEVSWCTITHSSSWFYLKRVRVGGIFYNPRVVCLVTSNSMYIT